MKQRLNASPAVVPEWTPSSKFIRWSAVAIVLTVWEYAWKPVYGYSDLFSHAAIGRWIAQHHALPRSTLFLWSAHAPYIAHSWLSELLFYRLMSVSTEGVGVTLCVCFTALAISAAHLLLWASRQSTPRALPMLFGIGIMADSLRFQPRPEAFSELLLAAVLVFLCRYRYLRISDGPIDGKIVLSFAGMVGLFILWTNIHGSVALGLLLMGVTCVCDGLQSRFDIKTQRLALLWICCSAAILCNPYGAGYLQIYRHINTQVFAQIDEWFPIYKSPMLSPWVVLGEALLVAVAGRVMAQAPDRRLSHIVWLILGVVMFVIARRNVLELTFICLAIAGYYSEQFFEIERRRAAAALAKRQTAPPGPAKDFSAVTAFYFLFWLFVFSRADLVYQIKPFTLYSAANVPIHQADYLIRSGVTGPMFNDYNNASYFEWRLYGHNTFFIDDVNAYGDAIMQPWRNVLEANADGIAYLNANQVDCVVGRNRLPEESDFPPLYYRLSHDPGWSLVYYANGPVWVRNLPKYRNILGKKIITDYVGR